MTNRFVGIQRGDEVCAGSFFCACTGTATMHFDAEAATTFDVFVKEPATSDFTLAAGDLTEKEHIFTNISGAPWLVKVVGRNAQGAGQESDEANFSGLA